MQIYKYVIKDRSTTMFRHADFYCRFAVAKFITYFSNRTCNFKACGIGS